MKRKILVCAIAVIFGLAGCAQGDATASHDGTSSSQDAANSDAQAGTEMPTVVGEGKDTHLKFPDSNPPEGLQKTVLDEGEGQPIEETDYVFANYVGQVWGNEEPFDSSFSRGESTGFSLTQVIPGWTKGLSGLKPGAKVILSIPADLGYGPSGGNPQAGIGKDDTIAFYVEIEKVYGTNQAGDPQATEETPVADLPVEITGELGKPITIKVKEGTPVPTEKTTKVIARGKGPVVPVKDANVYVQYAMAFTDNSQTEVTYGKTGPVHMSITPDSIFSGLAGLPVGSRVLIMAPSQGQNGGKDQPGIAVVVDILDLAK